MCFCVHRASGRASSERRRTHAGRAVRDDPLAGAADARAHGGVSGATAGGRRVPGVAGLTRDAHRGAHRRRLRHRVRVLAAEARLAARHCTQCIL